MTSRGPRRTWTTSAALGLAVLPGCAALGLARGPNRPPDPAEAARVATLGQRAQQSLAMGAVQEAESTLKLLIKEVPGSPGPRQQLGDLRLDQGRPREAIEAFEQVRAIEPEDVDALIGLGRADLALRRPGEAAKWFDTATERAPHRPEAHLGRGRAAEMVGQKDEALAAYFRALALDPGLNEAQLRVATIQRERGQVEQSIARLTDLLDQAPQEGEAHHQRGLALLARGGAKRALPDFEAAGRLLPQRPDVQYRLAQALHDLDQDDRARTVNAKALALAPNDPAALRLEETLRR